MKIFDWVIIFAYNKHLRLHDLQFSYQPKCINLHVHLDGNWNYIVFYAKWFRSLLVDDGYE